MPSRRSSCLSALFGMSYSGGKIFGKWRCNNRILVIMTGGPAVIPSGVIEREADMSICPEGYMPRIVDAEVQECLAIYGAVEICGTKWCGNYAEKRIMSGNGLPPQVIRSRQPRPFA